MANVGVVAVSLMVAAVVYVVSLREPRGDISPHGFSPEDPLASTTPAPTSPPDAGPPAASPPATSPPAASPPATSPPATSPPAASPPDAGPPATSLPATSPSATSPPAATTEQVTYVPLAIAGRIPFRTRLAGLFGIAVLVASSAAVLAAGLYEAGHLINQTIAKFFGK